MGVASSRGQAGCGAANAIRIVAAIRTPRARLAQAADDVAFRAGASKTPPCDRRRQTARAGRPPRRRQPARHAGSTGLFKRLFPELANLPRAGLVHRLDKGTSGLLVVARNAAEPACARQSPAGAPQWNAATWAVAEGRMVAGGARGPRPGAGSPQPSCVRAARADGRPAVTHIEVRERFPPSHVGRGALGDRTHASGARSPGRHRPSAGGRPALWRPRHLVPPGAPRPNRRRSVRDFPRQALHACRLAFAHPGERRVDGLHRSPLPADIARLVGTARTGVGRRSLTLPTTRSRRPRRQVSPAPSGVASSKRSTTMRSATPILRFADTLAARSASGSCADRSRAECDTRPARSSEATPSAVFVCNCQRRLRGSSMTPTRALGGQRLVQHRCAVHRHPNIRGGGQRPLEELARRVRARAITQIAEANGMHVPPIPPACGANRTPATPHPATARAIASMVSAHLLGSAQRKWRLSPPTRIRAARWRPSFRSAGRTDDALGLHHVCAARPMAVVAGAPAQGRTTRVGRDGFINATHLPPQNAAGRSSMGRCVRCPAPMYQPRREARPAACAPARPARGPAPGARTAP